MLKTVAISGNSKTGPIAVTYRSGTHETYGTCPRTCKLHPKNDTGAVTVDAEYLAAVADAVPRNGVAWTYSHFPAAALPAPAPGKTVFNASCDDMAEAVRTVELGYPAVYAAPKHMADSFPMVHRGVRFVRCPAELADSFTCSQCGNGSPLCARGDRDFVVVFVAHGSGAKRVGTEQGGGCYAASGPTAIQWHGTRTKGAANDAQAVRAFARSLPPGSMLRHHVAGDVGREMAA
ncbi:MAG: hypothetical protein EBT13_12525 [Rhodobacteraceae bacterium]|nr:hypothetical protein [Paracoccaceae bacterium]